MSGQESMPQLAAVVEQQLPLAEGLRALAEDAASRKSRRFYLELAKHVDQGTSLSDALAKMPKTVFQPAVVVLQGLHDAATQTSVLSIWDTYQRRFQYEARQFRALIAYPLVALLLSLAVAFWLTVLIGRVIEYVIMEYGVDVPRYLQVVQFAGRIPPWAYSVAAASAVLIIFTAVITVPRRDRQRLLLWVPIYGPLLEWHLWAAFFRLAAELVAARVPLADVFQGLEAYFFHTALRTPLSRIAAALRRGDSPAAAFSAARGVPPHFSAFLVDVDSQEEMERTLRGLSDVAEDRWLIQSSLLKRVVPPLILLLGCGGLALSIGAFLMFLWSSLRLFSSF